MKRTKQLSLHNLFYYMLAIALVFTACKKGDPGPKGDKGDKGDNGAAGTKGDKGDKGDPGTVNVSYSAWKDVTFGVDTVNKVFVAQISDNKITDQLLTTGEIKVYINLGTSTDQLVAPLPYIYGATQIRPFFEPGMIELDANVNASTATVSGNKVRQYRYVLIPGGTAIRMSKKVDWNNYEEVKAYLGIKD